MERDILGKRVLGLFTIVMAPEGIAAVYKWVDDEGVVQFSDSPPSKMASEEVIIKPDPQFVRPEPSTKSTNRDYSTSGETTPKLVPPLSAKFHELGPLPENTVSKYLKTTSTGFLINAKRRDASYTLTLKAQQGLPFGAVLEVKFANPSSVSKPFAATVRRQGGTDKIFVESPRFKGLKCGNFPVEIYIYRRPGKETLLGTHRQLVQSRVNLSKVKSSKALVEALIQGNCP